MNLDKYQATFKDYSSLIDESTFDVEPEAISDQKHIIKEAYSKD